MKKIRLIELSDLYVRWRICATCEKKKNKSYVGLTKSYVGDNKSYVGLTNYVGLSCIGLTKSYV